MAVSAISLGLERDRTDSVEGSQERQEDERGEKRKRVKETGGEGRTEEGKGRRLKDRGVEREERVVRRGHETG